MRAHWCLGRRLSGNRRLVRRKKSPGLRCSAVVFSEVICRGEVLAPMFPEVLRKQIFSSGKTCLGRVLLGGRELGVFGRVGVPDVGTDIHHN